MATQKRVFIAVIGAGGVGKCFISQLEGLMERVKKFQLCPVLISRSKNILYSEDYTSLSLRNYDQALSTSTQKMLSAEQIVEYLKDAPGKAIIVDNTSSQEIADQYPQFLTQGINVITPNKKAFSGSYELWESVHSSAANSSACVYHESTVGAGLPVISTLKELIDTGDIVYKIEGVFSGTMSFLFNSFAPTQWTGGKWSEEVKKAKDLGYTEPDPRDDLNGLDVARKLTILARIVGLQVTSPMSFPVQSLIPKELNNVTTADEFIKSLPDFDSQMEETKLAAEKEGKVVRYVGSINVETRDIKVGLEKFDKSHPIANLKGSDNLISFYTKRYGDKPLIIQGAGAGGEVTAMGVTGDLLKVLQRLS